MPDFDPESWPPGYEQLKRGAVLQIRGDKIIGVSRNGDTVTLTLSVAALLPFMPSSGGGGGGGVVLVDLEQTGGSDGSDVATPSYTYTVRTYVVGSVHGGSVLGTAMSPLRPRSIGSFSAAGIGLGMNSGGAFYLVEAFETRAIDHCPTTP